MFALLVVYVIVCDFQVAEGVEDYVDEKGVAVVRSPCCKMVAMCNPWAEVLGFLLFVHVYRFQNVSILCMHVRIRLACAVCIIATECVRVSVCACIG